MGKRGPLPKKKALRVMSGQLSITKNNGSDETIVTFDPPKVPAYISKEELEIWNITVELLKPLRVLENIDGAVLGAYCCSYVRWRAAEKEMKKEELTVPGANGNYVTNPLVLISKHACADMVTYAQQLGMTPAARMRVAIVKDQPQENPFKKLKGQKHVDVDVKSSKVRKILDDQDEQE